MSNTQILRREPTGVLYADPASPAFSVRFKSLSTAKSLGNLKTDNVATEIIINDKNTITKDAATADDPISIRIRISGSKLSHARMKALLSGVAAQLPAWANENVILGFEPTTVPVKY